MYKLRDFKREERVVAERGKREESVAEKAKREALEKRREI